MAELPDPLRSQAVLIGVSRYQRLNDIPAVHENLAALRRVLCDRRFWGLAPENCVVVGEPETAVQMLDPVTEAAERATDTLLVYYSGHGLVDPHRSELHLTLTGSNPQRMYTSVPYAHIRDLLLDSRAARRIVMLDCCYSGRALGQMASLASAVVDEASAEGTYVLAATAENKTALAPPGQRYTAFTGELLDVLYGGIGQCGPFLDLDSIYKHLLASMKSKGFPVPQKRDRNTAGQLMLIRNQAFQRHPGRSEVPLQTSGPWDASGYYPEASRVDLGSMLIPVRAGMEIQMVTSTDGGSQWITVSHAGSELQLQAFAAAETKGIWEEVRAEIVTEITRVGGQSTKAYGPFGAELYAQIPPLADQAASLVRFMGVDGPGWFLRGLLMGPAAEPAGAAGPFEEVFADVVVVRSQHPLPPRTLLEIRLPDDAAAAPPEQQNAAGKHRRESPTFADSAPATPLPPRRPAQLQYSAPSASETTADPYALVGRNDLCPCGSGRKFKRCHGAPPQPEPRVTAPQDSW